MRGNQNIVIKEKVQQSHRYKKAVAVNGVDSDTAIHLLHELKQLRADGVLSFDEFEKKKKRLLSL